MRVIKFSLHAGRNNLVNDFHIEPLWIEYQGDGFVVWCKEYSVLKQEDTLELYLAVTGEPVADGLQYVGTATTPERTFVVHLFRK